MASGFSPTGAWRPAPLRVAATAPRVAAALSAYVAVRLVVLLTVAVAAHGRGFDVHLALMKWDARWYARIADNGYGFTRIDDDGRLLSDYAFFPLLPWLERVVSAATGLGSADAGLLVAAVSSVVAAWGIFAVADHLHGPRTGLMITVLWAALPMGVVQSMAYTESLLTALAAWSLYAVLTQRWLSAGVLALLAGLARPTGAAMVAAVVVAAAAHHVSPDGTDRSRRTFVAWVAQPVVAALIAPVGLVAYLAWVGAQVGSPTGYFHVVSGWGNGFDGGAAFAGWTGSLLVGADPVSGVLVVVGVAALLGLFVVSVRQHQPLPLLVFAGVVTALALTTSGYFGSKPRYLVPAFPLLLPLAGWVGGLRRWVGTAILVGLTAVAAGYGAVWLLGEGPP